MTTYAIGDIQGCARSLDTLLKIISFDGSRDHLWLTGDLVNRGPDSLAVLRRLVEMDGNITMVLGNHDLHLLAAAANVRKLAPEDTLEEILDAPDAPQLINWLRHKPLLYYDVERDFALVHAGLPPAWSARAFWPTCALRYPRGRPVYSRRPFPSQIAEPGPDFQIAYGCRADTPAAYVHR